MSRATYVERGSEGGLVKRAREPGTSAMWQPKGARAVERVAWPGFGCPVR